MCLLCVLECARQQLRQEVFWEQVDVSSVGWLTASLQLSLRCSAESSGGNPPRTAGIYACVSFLFIFFYRANPNTDTHWGLIALTVCVHGWERAQRGPTDSWWCGINCRYTLGSSLYFAGLKLETANLLIALHFRLQLSGGLKHNTVQKQRCSLLFLRVWSLTWRHPSTCLSKSFFSFPCFHAEANNDEWKKKCVS